MKFKLWSLLILFLLFSVQVDAQQIRKKQNASATIAETKGTVWSIEKAHAWYNQHKWITGANYIPHTAINQLEMWQSETFDPQTIDKELGWAEDIGFNTMRVYLHSIAWKQDPQGFKQRVNEYLSIADKHKIKTILVFFDDVWNPNPQAGKQPESKPGIHNSGWMQDPGDPASRDSSNFPELERYVKDVMNHFKNDKRILLWDLYNEPGNSGKRDTSLHLLTKVFQWAREVNPVHPISVGLWAWDFEKLNAIQLLNSDIITYHNYEDPQWHQRVIEILKASGRPMICTEYMARTRNNRFSNTLPLLKKHNVGAINWGLVEGKSNTIYQWDTPVPDSSQPAEWFHDVFFRNGTPYRQDEINLIKKLNNESKQ
ncbi:MAG: cellulase family glycosylhydrolase [Bacteroidota bacterium]|jgi:endo-1,4-beta-mannosidase|nr:cellulase family glycosylhydrolase [Bacteroidota bacterium]